MDDRHKDLAAKEAHVQTSHFQALAQKLSDLLDKPFEVKEGAFIAGFEHR